MAEHQAQREALAADEEVVVEVAILAQFRQSANVAGVFVGFLDCSAQSPSKSLVRRNSMPGVCRSERHRRFCYCTWQSNNWKSVLRGIAHVICGYTLFLRGTGGHTSVTCSTASFLSGSWRRVVSNSGTRRKPLFVQAVQRRATVLGPCRENSPS